MGHTSNDVVVAVRLRRVQQKRRLVIGAARMELRLPAAILASLAEGASAAYAENSLTLGSNLRFWWPTTSATASSLCEAAESGRRLRLELST